MEVWTIQLDLLVFERNYPIERRGRQTRRRQSSNYRQEPCIKVRDANCADFLC